MTAVRKSGFSAALVGMAALVACGGSPPEPAETEPAPAEAAAPPEMLGGGVVTPVHDGQAGSPHVRVDWEVDGANISITYGRPYLRDRTVGDTVEPLDGSVWRLGADEATTLATDTDLMVGAAHVPAGEYTLWTLKTGDSTELIVNAETGQWGTAYDPAHDLDRTEMTVGTLDAPAEQLTLFLENRELRFEWGSMVASVPILVH
jgi:hypothetical protein